MEFIISIIGACAIMGLIYGINACIRLNKVEKELNKYKMIAEDYVSFETAKLLKERGFNEICEYEYGVPNVDKGYVLQRFFKPIKNSELIDDAYTAPTIGTAMKWLREIHKISIVIAPSSFRLDTGNCSAWTYTIWSGYNIERHIEFDTYEEACEAAIKNCLENLI